MGRRFHVLLSFFEVVESVHDFESFWSFKKSNQKQSDSKLLDATIKEYTVKVP